ncbi:MAG: amino acid adenylation domain-containing protein, partial [Clostridium sp.]|nr:amino acid adenylation domain-containing protein [Clostridium sp.]
NSIEDNKKYNWELSCVRSFIGSAEPLSEDLLNKFLDGLEKYNLNKNSMKNLYGMTESVLGITLTPAHKSMDFVRLDRKYLNIGDKVQSDKAGEGVVFAVSGTPLSSLEVRICDDDDNVLEDGVIGNIQVKGSNMTSGYYKNDLENKNLYTEDLWMRTGDIGFISNNNTVITGRKKDIIILNGQNIYAVDIERIVRQAEVKGVKKVAVCGAFDTKFYGEKLEIFVEYEGTLEQFIEDKRKIKGFISKKISIEVDNIIPIDEMPETSSGKIQRNVLKKRYLNGNFKEIIKKIQEKDFKKVSNDGHAEKDEVNDLIKNICCDILQEKDIGVNQDLFELGLHSISIMKIQSKIKKELDVEIEISDFINNNTIALLAEKVKNSYAVESISYPSLDSNKQDLYKPFPLTQVQMAYLMGRNENIEGGGVCTHFYHEIKTKYDIKKLNKCLNKLIDYYPMLRAVFNENGSQKILEHVPEYTILNKDISTFSNEEKEKFILNERKIMSHQVFEIDKWPLFEFKSYKVSSEDSYLFVSFDLLIADAASIFDIGQMLVDMYNNEEYNLPKIDFTFRDYMMGYKELRKSKLYEEDKNYWMEKIDDFSSAPALPYKINSTELKKPRYKRVSQIVSEEVWIKLKALARKNRVTPSSVLCTAYAKVLGFWSNQESLALNLTAFNRYPFNKDVDNIFGDFTSVVPLDISIDKQTEFFDQARRVQSTLMNSLQHRHYDGVEFIRELSRNNKFEIGKAVMPIVFSSLLFDNGRYGWNELGTIEMAVSQTPQVFIDNQVIEYDGKLLTSWDYVDELFDEKVINRMFEQYIDILNNVAQGNIDYSLDVSEEDKKFINKFNDTDVEREAKTLHELFKKKVKEVPNNVAVSYEDESLTYEELDKKSNKIANYLIKQNLNRNEYVGIIAERKIETIVNMLGVLKAGGAYVPMEPNYPQERIDYIVSNSKSRFVLDYESYEKLNIDNESEILIKEENHPEDIAYVIYTSGSTGKPKGVIIKHSAAVNTIEDINERFEVGVEDKIIGLSSMCFDLSVYDIFGSLTSGAELVMIEDQKDVKNIAKVMKEKGITVWNSVPAIMDMFLENTFDYESEDENYWESDENIEIDIEWTSNLKVVLLSGDWIPLSLPEKIQSKFMNTQVVALGGATEASIWSNYFIVEDIDEKWNSIPYGYPLSNQKFYVLNYNEEQCPVGVIGELCIGGLGVAEGYLNEEEKTKAAFKDTEKYGRIYKTGDFGVLRKEGYIEFLGRRDNQVKIRGYRIELGEIKNKILEYKDITNTAVIDREDENGRKYICAYIVSGSKIETKKLREYLIDKLPEYMIPNYFVQIDKIPLTDNGKVNRKALLEVNIDIEEESAREFVMPKSQVEQELCNIWSELLGIEKISTMDSFFEIGGNSLLMVQMITKIDKRLKVSVGFRELMEYRTIHNIAKFILKKGINVRETEAYEEIACDKENVNEPFKLTDVQMSYLLGRQKEYELGGVSTHVYIELETEFDMVRFNEALQQLINRHPMLRSIILPSGQQKILDEIPKYEIMVKDIRSLSEEEKNTSIIKERDRMSHNIFNPEVWPMFEFKALKVSDNKNYLFIGLDMLIADGASIQMIFKELVDNYNDIERSKETIGITFRDYMIAYEKIQQSDRYNKDREYWLNQLYDFPESAQLPFKNKMAEVTNPHFKRCSTIVEKDCWDKLQKAARNKDITPTVLLCTAYAEVLSYWSNQDDVAINTTVFNRYPFHKDVNKIIGDFTSVLPLGLHLKDKNNFEEKAKYIQKVFMDALDHRLYEGVKFIGELNKYKNFSSNRASLPIVFTSMLFGNSLKVKRNSIEDIGKPKMVISQTSQVCLDYQVMELENGISITWDYVDELFDEKVINRMFEQYIDILNNVAQGNIDYSLDVSEEDKKFI